MSANSETITKQPNGSYTWSCPIEKDYYNKGMGIGLKACIGIAVFLLLFGGAISWQYRDFQSFLIVAGCAAVYLLITFAAFGLAFSVKDPWECYEMTETYVKSGSGKSSVYFDYEKARIAVFARKYIELHGKIQKIRVYVPEKDFSFVKGYIQSRISGDCDMRYE